MIVARIALLSVTFN